MRKSPRFEGNPGIPCGQALLWFGGWLSADDQPGFSRAKNRSV